MSEAPAFLTLQNLSDDEESTRTRLIGQLRRVRHHNLRQQAFYEGSRIARDLGIAIPPHLKDVEAVAAWPEIVVDVLDERMDWRGWQSDDLALEAVYDENHLGIEVGQSVLDALICGLGFLSVGSGDVDAEEPEILVKAESPNLMTATWDPRLRRATEALREVLMPSGQVSGWTMLLRDQTITTERRGGRLVVTERDEHGMDRVPVAVLLNRPRSSRTSGRSEITRAVRSLTESGMRTLLGMEVAREFYAVAQRYLLGADESMFVDQEGRRKTAWDAMLGRMLAVPRDEDGELPTVGSFTPSSPQPFTEILKTYAQMLSAATGIPATHLGFTTDNPASADAIQRADKRVDKRAERREKQYDLGLVEAGNLCALWRDGQLPAHGAVRSLWVDPNALSPSAATDRAVKMISAGALDPSWDFTLEQFGLDDGEIKRLRQERLRSSGRTAIATLADAAAAARADQAVADLATTANPGADSTL